MLQPSGASGVRALIASCVTACAACSTAPVFGEAAGGAGTTTVGPTTGSSTTSAGPSTSSQGGAGDGGQGGDGVGGGGAAGPGGAGGQGGEGGAGCVSDCGERRCGVDACGRSCGPADDTWAIDVQQSVARLLLRPGTSDLYVLGDGDRIDRIDVCHGEPRAGADVFGDGSVRGAGLVGDALAVGVNVGDVMEAGLLLDPDSLAASPLPIGLPNVAPPDRIWVGAVHGGALWLGLDDDGGSLVRVGVPGAPENPSAERFSVGAVDPAPGGRGLASSPFGLLHQQGDARLALVDTESCAQGACEATMSLPLEAKGFQVAYADGQAFVPSFESGHGRLMRVSVPDLVLGPAVQRDVNALDDGFTDVAVHAGVVYVTGVVGGLEGSPWLLSYPPDFQTLTAPLAETTVEGPGNIGWAIAVDETGVYVAGSHESGGGFVVKCTHDLECPAISSAGGL